MPINFASRPRPRADDGDPWLQVSAELISRYTRSLGIVAELLPIGRSDAGSWNRDRYLSDLGELADSVIAQLLVHMRDHAAELTPDQTSQCFAAIVDLQQVRSSHQLALVEERLHVLHTAQRLISQIPDDIGVRALLERAASDVCELPGLSRSMVFLRDNVLLRPVATHFAGQADWAQECQEYSAGRPVDLGPDRPESEVIRRRTPAIVADAMNDPNAFRPIVHKIETQSYVVVPITAHGEVVATLHADAYYGERSVDEVDRDAVAAFAASLGHALERAEAIEQLRLQKQAAEQFVRSAGALLDGTAGLPSFDAAGGAAVPTHRPWGKPNEVTANLSRREHEVLQQLTKGATNTEIAKNLFIAEDTVKSHVKRLLRKLGASTRGQAVAIYVDSLSADRR